MSSILPFFDEPGNKGRQRIIPEAKVSVTYHCDNCGANLLTSQRRGAKVESDGLQTSVRCTKCGTENSLVRVSWSGTTDGGAL